MLIISTREFRDRQRSYLDKVDMGTEIFIRRRENKSYKIVPIIEDDTLMSKETYFAKLERGLQSVKEGKGKKMTIEQVNELLGI